MEHHRLVLPDFEIYVNEFKQYIHIIFLVLCLSLNIICKILPVVLDNNLFIFTAVYHSVVWIGHNTFILAHLGYFQSLLL